MYTYVIKIFLKGSKNEKPKFFIVVTSEEDCSNAIIEDFKVSFNCIHNVLFLKLSI